MVPLPCPLIGCCAGPLQVLTTGSWPTQSAAKCNMPRECEHVCQDFTDFYLKTHSGRRLTWQTNMGNADLKVGPVRMHACMHPFSDT